MGKIDDFWPRLPGLEGRTAVVTGGGGVLGLPVCTALVSSKVKTAVLDIKGPVAADRASWMEARSGVPCLGIEADVVDRRSLESAVGKVEAALGPIDFLINLAGGNSPRATTATETWTADSSQAPNFFQLDLAGFRDVFDLNLLGTVLPCQVVGEYMARRGHGVILNISSMNAFRPLTRIPAYSAAKASVNNFTQWLAVHLAPAGIRVNAVAPGFFLTDQNRFLLTDAETGEPTARGRKIITNTPMGRYGTPEELRGAILFLLSDLAEFITGVVLPVDGGYSAYGGV